MKEDKQSSTHAQTCQMIPCQSSSFISAYLYSIDLAMRKALLLIVEVWILDYTTVHVVQMKKERKVGRQEWKLFFPVASMFI